MKTMEARRLFIGGLHSDIKENDLNERFKSFGAVLGVEIIKRTDDTGCPIKTFAYIDIKQSEQDFKRCVSLLNNTKWKGGSLKIQVAKESFLARLAKERQHQDQVIVAHSEQSTQTTNEKIGETSRYRETPKVSAIPRVVPKAVPGTPLPGKKNWVVGKFGRVLPVVYLRRRDKRKLAKFDPSKTTHCLKKIELEEPSVSVTELTWNLDRDSGPSLKVMKKAKSPRAQINHILDKEENTGLTSDVETFQKGKLTQHKQDKISLVHLDNGEYKFGDSWSDPVINHVHSERNTKGKGIDPSFGQSQSTVSPTSTKSQSPKKVLNSSSSSKRKSFSYLKKQTSCVQKKGEIQRLNFIEADEVSRCIAGKRCNGTHSEEEGTQQALLFPELELLHCNTGEETRVQKGKSKVRVNDSSNEVSGNQLNGRNVLEGDNAESASKKQDGASRSRMSNEKRLDAVQKKLRQSRTQKEFIKDALQHVDRKRNVDGQKHVMFSDSDDGGPKEETRTDNSSSGEKISGIKASSWLGLDSDSGEENDKIDGKHDEKSDGLFTIKPQFEGRSGEKLFSLQKSFGGDTRFNLDERFLESEEGSDNENNATEDNRHGVEVNMKSRLMEPLSGRDKATDALHEGDEISTSLAKEKAMSINVLQNIFGSDINIKLDRFDHEKRDFFRSSSAVHYDPTREDHKLYERTAVEKRVEKAEYTVEQNSTSEYTALPHVCHDKYYDVNTSSLTKLFGRKSEDKPTFKFLAHEAEDEKGNSTEYQAEGSVEKLVTNRWMSSKLPYDSSGDEEDDEVVDDGEFGGDIINNNNDSSKASHLDQLFFFHPDDPNLSNRLSSEETPFMRTGSLEDATEYWVSVRSELTQDYKRKRKDAVRRQTKLAAKRNKMR